MIRLIGSFDTVAAYTSSRCGDLTGGQTLCAQRQDDLVDPRQPALSLLDDLRLERGLGVAGHLDGDRPDLGEHGLRPPPVAGIPAVAALGLILLLPQVLVHLGLERRFEHRRGQLVEQPVRAHQLTPSALACTKS